MKLRNVKKKIGSLLLAAAMIITSFSASATEVQAAGVSTAPTGFVTKEQLRTFNTDDTDGSTKSVKKTLMQETTIYTNDKKTVVYIPRRINSIWHMESQTESISQWGKILLTI